ncbi:MAG: divalent-cation tolerance protein CutA [Candidatus Dactylopiibacterium carminicum]|uniref:Divalent-cation tolerance protein CutA n=1 Tax=Candidatus Dactylopiibacterium carminicum TaxID=857335 RepID=A0A272EYH2_9RHOO|nr:divalent-cation tolerance protein CutA [Candidatus Dactylopiibacterium carminicum]KAF7600576.1 divalent-cation tolerance protein CutA [Candidatus Dactylopiibacterium carminicum]PAS94215.1 MAG: divalent-cation tolerance protein CutA [Candidatus Dactylopiibacterium carminicum]PAS95188.1 MAG: divalent-cation tolerance protein CutA [Candidatus Dactylopiibacterium carminicum]
MPDTVLLILCNAPDAVTAERIAQTLLERQLAACVNLLAPCRSIYRWQGNIETSDEHPMLIKSTQNNYLALEAMIRELHPYDVPEIIALPVSTGLPAYLDWVRNESAA